MRSLWVQGYTVLGISDFTKEIAFPVGTGIYRVEKLLKNKGGSVPCGYRDIPDVNWMPSTREERSLWVQGYTVTELFPLMSLYAFPVGTGIYRQAQITLSTAVSVPCGYRDIPDLAAITMRTQTRSLWVQGYTDTIISNRRMFAAFPVGTGIYRRCKRAC